MLVAIKGGEEKNFWLVRPNFGARYCGVMTYLVLVKLLIEVALELRRDAVIAKW